jgi:hypothetical protein
MSGFLIDLERKETEAANLFIRNARAVKQGDHIEIARELTDLRVQLQQTQELARETLENLEALKSAVRETTVFEYFLMCLLISTLVLLGIAYMFL